MVARNCLLEACVSVSKISHISKELGSLDPIVTKIDADRFLFHIVKDVDGVIAIGSILHKFVEYFLLVLSIERLLLEVTLKCSLH